MEREPRSLNREWILIHLKEAQEELQGIISDLDAPDYEQGAFLVGMRHLYHHLNTAWNARFESNEAHTECTQDDFDRWRKFPANDELLLD